MRRRHEELGEKVGGKVLYWVDAMKSLVESFHILWSFYCTLCISCWNGEWTVNYCSKGLCDCAVKLVLRFLICLTTSNFYELHNLFIGFCCIKGFIFAIQLYLNEKNLFYPKIHSNRMYNGVSMALQQCCLVSHADRANQILTPHFSV